MKCRPGPTGPIGATPLYIKCATVTCIPVVYKKTDQFLFELDECNTVKKSP